VKKMAAVTIPGEGDPMVLTLPPSTDLKNPLTIQQIRMAMAENCVVVVKADDQRKTQASISLTLEALASTLGLYGDDTFDVHGQFSALISKSTHVLGRYRCPGASKNVSTSTKKASK
jgi:hypothetical protein